MFYSWKPSALPFSQEIKSTFIWRDGDDNAMNKCENNLMKRQYKKHIEYLAEYLYWISAYKSVGTSKQASKVDLLMYWFLSP